MFSLEFTFFISLLAAFLVGFVLGLYLNSDL